MNNETCLHGGISPINLLDNLHFSQGRSGRHKCPTCAYEQGFILGSSNKWSSYSEYCLEIKEPETCAEGSIAPTNILTNLGENQGGKGRHKCTNCAFKEGFELGLLENNIKNIELILVPVPSIKPRHKQKTFKPHKNIDFIEKEQKNKRLGLLGELFVIKIEKDFLISKGRNDLAEKIQHISKDVGDGLGYDIMSYTLNGDVKYIEVKTTRGEITRPFYITLNEIEFSKKEKDNYYLFRLFDFDTEFNKGKYYQIKGELTQSLYLDAILFLASPI